MCYQPPHAVTFNESRTGNNMTRIEIVMDLEEEALAKIDEAAKKEGLTREGFFLLAASMRALTDNRKSKPLIPPSAFNKQD